MTSLGSEKELLCCPLGGLPLKGCYCAVRHYNIIQVVLIDLMEPHHFLALPMRAKPSYRIGDQIEDTEARSYIEIEIEM